MDFFTYIDGQLHAESISLSEIATTYNTPCYVYSRATIERHWRAFDVAFSDVEHLICYAVKANSNLAVLNLMARMGSGFDIVSVGELERVIAAGGDPSKVVFSGVGKRTQEIERALEVGIHCFNIESSSELDRINSVATRLGMVAPVSFRVNPDVDAKTHPYIATGLKENKFGIAIENATALYLRAASMDNLKIKGIDCHIGSQLTNAQPFADALDRILELVDQLYNEGIALEHIDLGGGLGISYTDENPPLPGDYAAPLLEKLAGRDLSVIIEPGRAIVGNAGVLLTTVEYIKQQEGKSFAVVDAAMNDLMRPALYQAYQNIIPVTEQPHSDPHTYDVVGPICETGDFIGKDRQLAVTEGDLLAVRSSGAYGFSMSSNYNSRPRAAEVMVDGNKLFLVRERETVASLFQGEHLLPPT